MPILIGFVAIELAVLYAILFVGKEDGKDILPNPKSVHGQKKERGRAVASSPVREVTVGACEVCVSRVNAFYGDTIKLVAKERGIDWRLLTAMVATEVGGLNTPAKMAAAIGASGEIGLMQIKTVAAGEFGVLPHELYHPVNNLRTGSAYFLKMKEEMRSNKLALLAYNEGKRGAEEFLSAGARAEDHRYVQKVSANAAVLGFRVK